MMTWTILTVITIIWHISAAVEWNYTDFSAWPGICTTGRYQSPINIQFDFEDGRHLEFYDYDKLLPLSSKVTNNGHYLQMNPGEFNKGAVPCVGVRRTHYGAIYFKFAQLHFHWGDNKKKGSEHTIRGKTYPLEMHMVHYRWKYDSLMTAVNTNYRDAVLVIGVLFENKYNSKSKTKRPPGFANIIRSMKAGSAISKGESRSFKQFALDDILPKTRTNFYYYSGSLTTPNCNEVVQWFVLEDKLRVKNDDLKAFRKLKSADGVPISSNHRPTQRRTDL